MTIPNRQKRAGLLCAHFTRNLAYYLAGWEAKQIVFPPTDVWKTINSNFLDVAVLEWSKLFADQSARHHWRKVVVDPSSFLPQMLSDIELGQSEWAQYLKEMRAYRDKFIAHLDDLPVMNIPLMGVAEKATFYIYDTIRAEYGSKLFRGLPPSLRAYSTACQVDAKKMYANAA